jgi:hypothetical protein
MGVRVAGVAGVGCTYKNVKGNRVQRGLGAAKRRERRQGLEGGGGREVSKDVADVEDGRIARL